MCWDIYVKQSVGKDLIRLPVQAKPTVLWSLLRLMSFHDALLCPMAAQPGRETSQREGLQCLTRVIHHLTFTYNKTPKSRSFCFV